jgi:hypothetical protein
LFGTDYGFFVFGTVNSVMMLILYLCMKETKGLSEVQISRLYLRDTQVKDMVELPYLEKPAEESVLVKNVMV